MKVLSLFSGCGGLDMGFVKNGYDIVWANDIDKYAVQTYKANFKATPHDPRLTPLHIICRVKPA